MPSLIVPVTRHGRLSVGLSVVSLVSLAVFFLMVGLGQRGGAGFFDNWLLTGPILVVAIAGTGDSSPGRPRSSAWASGISRSSWGSSGGWS